MSPVRALQAIRIAVEAGAVVVATAWGFHAASGPARWLLTGACAALLIAGWGRYVAPKSPHRLADPARLALELGLFITVAIAATDLTSTSLGLAFGSIAVADAVGLRVLETHHAGSRRLTTTTDRVTRTPPLRATQTD